MDILKKYFPTAFQSKELTPFIISLVILVVFGAIGGAIIGFLSQIAIVGIVFSIIGAIIELYVLVGIVLSILVFTKVIA